MITRNDKLDILSNITIDYNLPKYQSVQNSTNGTGLSGMNFNGINSVVNTKPSSANVSEYDYLHYILHHLIDNRASIISIWKIKLRIFIFRCFFGDYFEARHNKTISFEELKNFFDVLKASQQILKANEIDDILSKYQSLLDNAQKNSQIALVEKIQAYSNTLKYELLLCNGGFNKYLNEDDVVAFYKKASVHSKFKTALKLTYIKNFVKIIPDDVAIRKQKADELLVFDNYIILHYDYDGKAVEDTKEEKEKKKDPILFGVIQNSNRLYYIGDWIDDYCDLTLDVLIQTIGKQTSEITPDNITDNMIIHINE